MTICQLVKVDNPVISLELTGNLKFYKSSDELGRALSQYLSSENVKYVALDCSNAAVVSSSGLGEFVRAHVSAVRTGKQIVFVSPSQMTSNHIQKTGLHQALKVYDSFSALAKDNSVYQTLAALPLAKDRK